MNADDICPTGAWLPGSSRYGFSAFTVPQLKPNVGAPCAGFPTVFSVGMLQAGMLATYVTDLFGAENVRSFAVQFREQVWPGDHLACEATVKRRYEEDGERRVDLDLLVTRQESGGAAIKGEATFAVS